MAEYSKLAKGHFTSTGFAQFVNLPFQPDYVRFTNYTLANSAATSQNVISGFWDVSMGQGQAVVQGYNATPALIYDVVSNGGISTFAAGLMLQYGPLVLLGSSGGAGIAKTSGTVLTVTTAAAHGLQPGDWIIFQNLYETLTTGMQQIAGIPFQVQSAGFSSTAFQVAWLGNASNLTVIDTSATGAAGFKKILFPTLYEPGVCFPYTITVTAGVGTVTCTAPHNFKIGQEIAFRIPSVYGAQNLNELPDPLTPGKPKYFYVVSTPSATQFTFANAPVLSTAYVVDAAFTSFPGLNFAQCVAVGDVNTGGDLYSGGNLYPSPNVFTGLVAAPTINGPAIQGAYINNTSQGFIIGSGSGRVLTTADLVGAAGNIVYWEAILHDYSVN